MNDTHKDVKRSLDFQCWSLFFLGGEIEPQNNLQMTWMGLQFDIQENRKMISTPFLSTLAKIWEFNSYDIWNVLSEGKKIFIEKYSMKKNSRSFKNCAFCWNWKCDNITFSPNSARVNDYRFIEIRNFERKKNIFKKNLKWALKSFFNAKIF